MSLVEKMKELEKTSSSIKNDRQGYYPYKLVEIYLKSTVLYHLKEAYKTPNLFWVHDFVEQIYKDPDNALEISKKYKIKIEVDYSDNSALISSAAYRASTKEYIIRCPFDTFRKIDEGLEKEEFEIELMEFLIHEETHQQQNQLNHYKQHYIPDFRNREEAKIHISQKVEIDANARGIGYELSKKLPGLGKEDLLDIAIKGKLDNFSLKLQATLSLYREIGGKVWRTFLKELYEYLHQSDRLGLADYNKWLSDRTNTN